MTKGPALEGRVVDLQGLQRVALNLLDDMPTGGVVWLSGDLGSGKTAFVQQLLQALGARDVSSPTYALIHEYQSDWGKIYHVDCYRLNDPEEALDLDFPELMQSGVMLLIEWPERAGSFAPPADVHLAFSHVGDPERRAVRVIS